MLDVETDRRRGVPNPALKKGRARVYRYSQQYDTRAPRSSAEPIWGKHFLSSLFNMNSESTLKIFLQWMSSQHLDHNTFTSRSSSVHLLSRHLTPVDKKRKTVHPAQRSSVLILKALSI